MYYRTCYDQSAGELQINLALKRKYKKMNKLLSILVNKRQIYANQIGHYESVLAEHLNNAKNMPNKAGDGEQFQEEKQTQTLQQLQLEIEETKRRIQYYLKYYKCIDVDIDSYQRKLNLIEMQMAQIKNGKKKIEDQRLEFY